MIQSMTGYGKAMATYGDKKIFAEIRSLNSKALDLSTRIAPLYREKEMEVRAIISTALERGKVDFNLWVEKDATEAATPINGALVANYYAQIKGIAEQYGIGVIMELAGQLSVFEYIPDSEMKEEYHPIKQNGEREFGQSSFGFLNYFHPEVEEKICVHYREAARAYRDFPALIGYDIFNETMFRSYDEYTLARFREWLFSKHESIV